MSLSPWRDVDSRIRQGVSDGLVMPPGDRTVACAKIYVDKAAPASLYKEEAMKELKCRDAGFDCDAVVHGNSVEEVMAQVRPHAKDVHQVDVTPDMEKQLSGVVRDV